MNLRMSNKLNLNINSKPGKRFPGFCLLLIFLFSFSFGQTSRQIIIQGEVLNTLDHTPVPTVTVVLQGENRYRVGIETDFNGQYKFILTDSLPQKVVIYILTGRCLHSPTAPCGFLASGDKRKIDLKDTLPIIYKADFTLHPLSHCGDKFRAILFKKNSAEPIDSVEVKDWIPCPRFGDTIYYLKPESYADDIYKTLTDNPSIIIELSAHSSQNEKNPEELSQVRANAIVQLLVKKGIPKERLVGKGYGIKKLKISPAQINKAKTKEEKEKLHAINRRVVFKIISWDYPAAEEPKYKPKVDTTGADKMPD